MSRCRAVLGLLLPRLLWLSWGLLALGLLPGTAGRARAQNQPLARPATATAAPAPEPGPPSSRRCRWVRLAPGRDTTYFTLPDTLTVVPASATGPGGRPMTFDPATGRFRWVRVAPLAPLRPVVIVGSVTADSAGRRSRLVRQLPLAADSVLICYRVLPVALERFRFRRPRRLLDSLDFRDRPMLGIQDFSRQEQILSTPGINKSGNLSRGLSFGNTQNVFVNSALNLQLEGMLTEKIRLTAAISDQNVPFQPEGNTQTLQQFDRIYLTLAGPQWSLTAGDVVLRNRPDYFLRFYKNMQGAAVEVNLGSPTPPAPGPFGGGGSLATGGGAAGLTTAGPGSGTNNNAPPPNDSNRQTPPPNDPNRPAPPLNDPNRQAPPSPRGEGGRGGGAGSTTLAAAGVAKGKFASIDLTPLDNVQGPYRLSGPNGEQFIIVLAGSERVFLDGRLQARGFDYDYVIDYNLAEITFSPRHLITRNSRLKVDFEYSDLNYARSLYTVSHYQQLGRGVQVRGNFYQESDNPDNAANLTLSLADRRLLRGAGNVAAVQAPGADPVAWNRRQVQYRQVQRVPPGGGPPVSAFEFARDSLQQVYNVRFTDVGGGQGDYNLSLANLNANGRVFEFAGAGQGRYRAVRVLPTPLLKQLVSGGVSWQLDPTALVFVDVARSALQRNRFDTTGVRSQDGGAVRVGYEVRERALPAWAPAVLQKYRLRSNLDYEHTAAGFAPIDRYRDIEFDRNWSAVSTANATRTDARTDDILNFGLGLTRDGLHGISYRLSQRRRPGEVDGTQHWLDAAERLGRVELRGSLFVLRSQAGRFRSEWARGEASARFDGGRWFQPGYAYRFDKNRVISPQGDTVRSVNYFDEHTLSVQSADSGRTRYALSYGYRRDQTPTPEQKTLQLNAIAQTWQASLRATPGRFQDLRLLATYRDVNRVSRPDSARQRNLLGRLDYNVGLLQNQIRSELSYSVQTGRELRRDFSFVAVPAGQGTHYYAGDLNGNGVQDKDEFLEAQTPDAQFRTYIKVFLPTADYLTAYQNRLSYRLSLAAPRGWRETGDWRAALARLSSITSVTVDRRTTSPALLTRLSPFSFTKDDDQLLAFNQLLRNTLYFNRANPVFGMELTVQQTQQKTLLAQGFDLRNLAGQSLLLRRTLAQSFTGRFIVSHDVREAQASYSQVPGSPSYRNYRLLIYTAQPEISYQPSPALRLTGTLLHSTKRNAWPERAAEASGTFTDLGLETRLSQVGKRTLTASTHATRVEFAGEANSVVGLEILQALRPGANYTWNLNLEQRLANGLNINLAYDGRKASGLNVVHTGRMQVAVLF